DAGTCDAHPRARRGPILRVRQARCPARRSRLALRAAPARGSCGCGTLRLPEGFRLTARLLAFRPRTIALYTATDVAWNYALFLLPGQVLKAILDSIHERASSGPDAWSLLALLAALQVPGAAIGTLGWYSHQRGHRIFHALCHANLLAGVLRPTGAERGSVSRRPRAAGGAPGA